MICSLLYSKSCYTRFVGSITDQLAVFQCLDVILSETFRLDIFLDLLYEQDFFTDEERERIECHITFSGSSKQKAFIDVLKSKLVEECCSFQKFFDCLNTDSTLKELELKIFEKKRDLQKIIVVRLRNNSSTFSRKNSNQQNKPLKVTGKDMVSESISD